MSISYSLIAAICQSFFDFGMLLIALASNG